MCRNVASNAWICVLEPGATNIGVLLVDYMINETFKLIFMLDLLILSSLLVSCAKSEENYLVSHHQT